MSLLIEAVYVIDINGHEILDYPIASSPPTLKSLIPLIINPNISHVPPPVIEVTPSRLIFHQKYGNMMFILPCSSTIPSMVPFEFINRLIETLESYFTGPLIPMKIESNLDTVTLILNEMIEGGYPDMTEPDAIKDIVPYGGLLTKLLSGGPKPSGLTSAKIPTVPWRRSNVRHTNNELFVDLIETLYLVFEPSSRVTRGGLSSSAFYTSSSSFSSTNTKPIISRVEGAISVTSHLSGLPDIQLVLNNGPHKIEDPSFHQCVDYSKWKSTPGTFSFIPPDGKHLLASYTLDNVGQGLVFAEMRTGLGVAKDEFEVRLWTIVSREVKAIELLAVNVICDKSKVRNIKGLRVSSGDFHFTDAGIGEWRFPGKTQLGWNATLRGSLNAISQTTEDTESNEPPEILFPNYLSISYTLSGQVPSGIKVQNLRIVSARGLGESVKPYKGVRYTTKVGQFIVR